jgi:phosphoglycerol transferase
VIGSVGFLGLLAYFLLWKRGGVGSRVTDGLGYLTVAAVLLATVGGFGSLVALFLGPWIRSYNRISVFLGFFALMAVAMVLQELLRKYITGRYAGLKTTCILAAILAVGMFDQSALAVGFRPEVPDEYRRDADFVRQIEARVPADTLVFEMPYHGFPEVVPVNHLQAYELARPYLHSHQLRWSYGAMKGRDGDLWLHQIADCPTEMLLKKLAVAGFGGIFIDRRGFPECGVLLEQTLAQLLGENKIISSDHRCAFFSMADYSRRLRERYTTEQWERLKFTTLNDRVVWQPDGFLDLTRGAGGQATRGGGPTAELLVRNSLNEPRKFKLQMKCGTAFPVAHLRLECDLFTTDLDLDGTDKAVVRELMVPPGDHVIKFICNGPLPPAPPDWARAAFMVHSFDFSEME